VLGTGFNLGNQYLGGIDGLGLGNYHTQSQASIANHHVAIDESKFQTIETDKDARGGASK